MLVDMGPAVILTMTYNCWPGITYFKNIKSGISSKYVVI